MVMSIALRVNRSGWMFNDGCAPVTVVTVNLRMVAWRCVPYHVLIQPDIRIGVLS